MQTIVHERKLRCSALGGLNRGEITEILVKKGVVHREGELRSNFSATAALGNLSNVFEIFLLRHLTFHRAFSFHLIFRLSQLGLFGCGILFWTQNSQIFIISSSSN